MKNVKNQRMNLRMTAQEWRRLEVLASRNECTKSEFIRKCLNDEFEKWSDNFAKSDKK